jgi:hypothetical protein
LKKPRRLFKFASIFIHFDEASTNAQSVGHCSAQIRNGALEAPLALRNAVVRSSVGRID